MGGGETSASLSLSQLLPISLHPPRKGIKEGITGPKVLNQSQTPKSIDVYGTRWGGGDFLENVETLKCPEMGQWNIWDMDWSIEGFFFLIKSVRSCNEPHTAKEAKDPPCCGL